jgi:hypothetical protein
MRLGVHLVEQPPQREVEQQQQRDLIEADGELRRPAAPQRQQRKAALEVVRQGCEQPWGGRPGKRRR